MNDLTARRLRNLYWGTPPMSAHRIARELGVSHTSVIYRLRKFGIPVRPPASGDRSPIPMDIDNVKAMYLGGMTLQEIAKEKSVQWESVRKYLRRAGVQMRAPHARLRATCKETGCSQPVEKKWHNVLKGYYGTRCAFHRKQHYAILNRHRVRRIRKLTPHQWAPARLKYPEMQSHQLPMVSASVSAVESLSINLRCSVKACAFPAAKDGLCPGHYRDSLLETSVLGSSLAEAIRESHLLSL